MGVKRINLVDFSLDPKLGLKDYSSINASEGIRIKNVLVNKSIEKDIKSGRTPSKYNEDFWNGDFDFFTMQDVDTATYSLNDEVTDKITEFAIDNDKTIYQAPANSLIVSNAMTIGLAVIVDRPIFLNQNVFHLDIDPKLYNIVFLKWYFNLKLRKSFNETFASKYYSKSEYGRLFIPNVPIEKQNEICKKIILIEDCIKNLKSSRISDTQIINKVFCEEFDFNVDIFENLKLQQKSIVNFSDLAKTQDFRLASKFHSIKYSFLNLDIFKKYRFDDFSLFMTLGRQIKPDFYAEESDYYYLMPNSVRTFSLNDQLMQPIQGEFYDKYSHIAFKKDDLILVASGEGSIGKSAIYNSDKQAIASQFIMKIELKDKNLATYFHYYMQSSFFLLTVEKFKKGMGNMTNIFVSQVKDFPILFDDKKVNKIVSEIKSQIDSQSVIDKQIEDKQNEIRNLIEEALMDN